MKSGCGRQHRNRKVLGRVMSVALLLVVVLLLLMAAPVMSADADLYTANWLKSPTPVLPVGTGGSWDETGVGVSSVIYDVDTYKMWYTGYDADGLLQIGYATSTDGVTDWTKDANNPVLTPGASGAWDDKGVGSPCVIKADPNDYRMWYTGYTEISGELVPQIGYATSTDGITNWTKDASNPVLTPGASGAWDDKGVLSASVMYDVDTFKMWYTGRSGTSLLGLEQIGYATSTDGITGWAKDANNPVLTKGPIGKWDQDGVSTASVVKDTGGTYYIYYSGYSGFTRAQMQVSIGVAQSADGITSWTRGGPPVLVKAPSGWNSGGVGAPCVLEKSATELVMYYSGVDSELSASQAGIAVADVTPFTLTGTVILQGGLRPDPAGYQLPLTLKLYDPFTTLDITTILTTAAPMYTYTGTGTGGDITITTIDSANKTIDFSVDVPSGLYQVTLVTPHSLISLKKAVLTSTTPSVNMGTLTEGNSDDSAQITGADFSLLINDYLQVPGGPKWNGGRCDYDREGQVNSIDFSLLSMNYNEFSPQAAS